MRLKQIKLAGFKSFVDPTTVTLPSNRCAVVGPNGCGKSNIIDAVRWVMGESSAKQLRGENLTDVIFNGSNSRKPTAIASIELIFDNRDGRIGGEYAAYAEISIRRQVTRDSQSAYFLNGNKCRRRDIMDIFLGTGFGPRSYSIIEQGMINQLVEAKPEDLRVYLEEAAGISKYKERRRETENRIRHTRENLSRLNDIREELDKQLKHLDRQAKAAERYRVLKEEERQLTAQLYALKYGALEAELAGRQAEIRSLEVSSTWTRRSRPAARRIRIRAKASTKFRGGITSSARTSPASRRPSNSIRSGSGSSSWIWRRWLSVPRRLPVSWTWTKAKSASSRARLPGSVLRCGRRNSRTRRPPKPRRRWRRSSAAGSRTGMTSPARLQSTNGMRKFRPPESSTWSNCSDA
jgi:energy-coupling factor transporter ATP-binding protein EcfA2